jgi:catechol 2,3-dioxygenase-like lactoylglutathione lyase family enzyme
MLTGIDHVILAVSDPDAAAELLEDAVGLRAGGGGRHETVGTFNRLVWLGDSYFELVGVFDAELAEAGMFGRHINRLLSDVPTGGYAGVALASDDVAADVVRLRAQASGIADPIDGQRLRPDGRIVRWRTGRLAEPDPDLGLAFLIEHDTTGAEWSDAERAERAAQTSARLVRVEVPASQMQRATQRLHRDLGLAFRPSLAGGGARDTSIGSQILRLVPGTLGTLPTIVLRGGSASREASVLGCNWVVEPQITGA